jgi:16S rRNA G966 N2-methylase RsmD
MQVLETCTGGGFSTIALACYAERVITVEIDSNRVNQAKYNCSKAGVIDKVQFLHGDVLSSEIRSSLPDFEAAYLDPDWAVTGTDHVFRFRRSNTKPPSDELLRFVLGKTDSAVLIQPPTIDAQQFNGLPSHEVESLFLDDEHALYCLYFGRLKTVTGRSIFQSSGPAS